MREILHKGKRVDTHEWIEGFFVIEEYSSPTDVRPAIIPVKENGSGLWGEKSESDYDAYEVAPETVCQHTGLTDKNDKKIWEWDIVSAWSEGVNAQGTVERRADGLWILYPTYQKKMQWGLCPNDKGETTVEVIGNIFDGDFNGKRAEEN